MNYKEEIKKLQARVDELEKKSGGVEKPQHEFKVGDRVQFKTWEELENEFGKAKSAFGIRLIELPSGSNFMEPKKYLGGTYATISEIKEDGQVFLKDFSRKSHDNLLWQYSIDILKPAKTEPRWSFTEDEKTILRNLPEGYKWIARDEDDILCCFKSRYKPTKDEFFGVWNCVNAMELRPFSHIFQCIKWSDDEPCEFRKFL